MCSSSYKRGDKSLKFFHFNTGYLRDFYTQAKLKFTDMVKEPKLLKQSTIVL